MKHLSLAVFCGLATLPLHAAPIGAAPPASSTRLANINLLQNADFEAADSSQGWEKFWMRLENSGEMAPDKEIKHGGRQSLRVSHHGAQDWSTAQQKTVAVRAGDVLRIGAWLRCERVENAEISVVARRADGETLDWMLGRVATNGTHDWQHFERRLVVPAGCVSVQFRLTGSGAGTIWLDDAELVALGNINNFKRTNAKALTLSNRFLEVRFPPQAQGGAFSVLDRRNGRAWKQQAFGADVVLRSAKLTTSGKGKTPAAILDLWDVANDLNLRATLSLAADKPEISVAL
ncbi:MAG TPA: carbohydrate binding domain-containing protein, partial [Abditibacteriaceae bacterium]|nr:carbohydrate binding domain-containing protein [Abditibacteriaceae bacterium]